MSDKTIVEIYDDAWSKSKGDEAVACAAVAEHIVEKMLAAHVAECHATDLEATVRKVLCNIKIGGIEFVERPKPVESPQPEAGDWAMECVRNFRGESFGMYGGERGDGPSDYDKRIATVIREAAERHYRAKFTTIENANGKLIQERDAARAERDIYEAELTCAAERLEKTHRCGEYKAVGLRQVAIVSEQVCDELDAARTECEQLKLDRQAVANAAAKPDADVSKFDTPPAATGDDELMWAVLDGLRNADDAIDDAADKVLCRIRPMFDALRRERDEWKSKYHNAMTSYEWACGCGDEAIKRAEAAEAALGELKEAVAWAKKNNCDPSWSISENKWFSNWLPKCGIEVATCIDAILAAYRNTKAESAAEGAVKQ